MSTQKDKMRDKLRVVTRRVLRGLAEAEEHGPNSGGTRSETTPTKISIFAFLSL